MFMGSDGGILGIGGPELVRFWTNKKKETRERERETQERLRQQQTTVLTLSLLPFFFTVGSL